MAASSVIEKVRKLLELANNDAATENEAMVAMLKAQKLMKEAGVSEDDLGADVKEEIALVHIVLDVWAGCDHKKWRAPLAHVIAKNYQCEPFFVGKELAMLGHRKDAEIAVECFKYAYVMILKLGDKIAQRYYRDGLSARGVTDSYADGFIAGLSFALGRQSKALMIVTPQDVKDHADMIKSGEVRQKRSYQKNVGAFADGFHDGKNFFSSQRLEGAV